jgi:hypothetical protein
MEDGQSPKHFWISEGKWTLVGHGESGGVHAEVAVDGAGNVFVEACGVKEILAAGGYTTVKTLPIDGGDMAREDDKRPRPCFGPRPFVSLPGPSP